MTRYLLDTNLLSEILKKRPSPAVLTRLAEVENDALATSAISVMELRFGAARHPDGERLWRRIRQELLPRVLILPIDGPVAVRAGDVLARLESNGQRIGTEDALIAASGLVHEMTVVTRNLRHFERVPGLAAESWWD